MRKPSIALELVAKVHFEVRCYSACVREDFTVRRVFIHDFSRKKCLSICSGLTDGYSAPNVEENAVSYNCIILHDTQSVLGHLRKYRTNWQG